MILFFCVTLTISNHLNPEKMKKIVNIFVKMIIFLSLIFSINHVSHDYAYSLIRHLSDSWQYDSHIDPDKYRFCVAIYWTIILIVTGVLFPLINSLLFSKTERTEKEKKKIQLQYLISYFVIQFICFVILLILWDVSYGGGTTYHLKETWFWLCIAFLGFCWFTISGFIFWLLSPILATLGAMVESVLKRFAK